ncbi:uncharacterized protein PITG_21544, partial [Phytophthora infestans T30-4]
MASASSSKPFSTLSRSKVDCLDELLASTADVDDFVAALPVKEMRDIDKNLSLRGENYLHDYLWMMRWLRTCMELSEVYLLSVTSVAEGEAEGLDSKDVDVKAVPFSS